MTPGLGWPILRFWVAVQWDPGPSWALSRGIIKVYPAEAERERKREREILERVNDLIYKYKVMI